MCEPGANLMMWIQAAGIDPQAPRKEWPRELLRQVVTDLMRDAPRGMLAREILAGAASAADWCVRQQAHARSSAVMSVVGIPLQKRARSSSWITVFHLLQRLLPC